MPTDLFRSRAPGDTAHPMLPLPGRESGSVAFEEDDGNAITLSVNEIFVDVTDGRTTRRIIYGDDLRATLAVTDSRVIFASTKMLKSFRGTRGQTFMGHIRYEWLEGLDGANSRATLLLARPSYLRLFVRDPVDSDWLTIATFKPGRGWGGKDVAIDVARRAEARRSGATGDDTGAFTANDLENGGTRWLAQPAGAEKLGRIVDTLSAKGLGALGLG